MGDKAGQRPVSQQAGGQAGGGLAIAVLAFAILSCGDAVVKSMAGQWAGTAVASLRFALGALGLGSILWWREGWAGFFVPRLWLQMLRGLALASGSLCFFLSLFIMPQAEATAIQFASPVLTAILSRLFLGERLPRIGWLAMILASIGVVVVLRPNIAALGITALMPLFSAAAMSCFFLLNRISGRDVPPLAAQFWVAAWATPVQMLGALVGMASGVAGLQLHWPDLSVVLRCLIVAVTASTAHWLLYVATTRASAATIAPAGYVQIIVALLIGMAVFGDFPDFVSIAGTLCIVVAGLLLWMGSRPGTMVFDGTD